MKTIKVLKSKTNLIPLVQFLRWYRPDWHIHECLDWAKSLPKEVGPIYNKSDFDNLSTRLLCIAEIEVNGEWEPENYQSQPKSQEVIEAEKWMLSLTEEDQYKIKTLIDYARKTAMPS